MKTITTLFLVFAVSTAAIGQETATKEKPKADAPAATSALDFKMKSIDGKEVELSKYKGNVVLFVNTASKCGLTPQYEQLQALHEKYSGKGLSVVGFPCNQFGGQEPGTESDIKAFCTKNYGVTFDMMSKIDVNGDKQCDLYKYLNGLDAKPKGKGDVRWNFEKYLVDRNGQVVGRFGSRTKPSSDEFVKVIEAELEKK